MTLISGCVLEAWVVLKASLQHAPFTNGSERGQLAKDLASNLEVRNSFCYQQ